MSAALLPVRGRNISRSRAGPPGSLYNAYSFCCKMHLRLMSSGYVLFTVSPTRRQFTVRQQSHSGPGSGIPKPCRAWTRPSEAYTTAAHPAPRDKHRKSEAGAHRNLAMAGTYPYQRNSALHLHEHTPGVEAELVPRASLRRTPRVHALRASGRTDCGLLVGQTSLQASFSAEPQEFDGACCP